MELEDVIKDPLAYLKTKFNESELALSEELNTHISNNFYVTNCIIKSNVKEFNNQTMPMITDIKIELVMEIMNKHKNSVSNEFYVRILKYLFEFYFFCKMEFYQNRTEFELSNEVVSKFIYELENYNDSSYNRFQHLVSNCNNDFVRKELCELFYQASKSLWKAKPKPVVEADWVREKRESDNYIGWFI